MDLQALNIVVLDLETARSADDCRHCGKLKELHEPGLGHCNAALSSPQFSALGWNNKPALGLSIGCYYAYSDDQLHWFDRHRLEATMISFVESACLLVSFNGISFDFPLMRGLLRQEAEALLLSESGADLFRAGVLTELCDRFKALCAQSYDILAEIWRVDPEGKFARGLNSLDAIAQANGLAPKAMIGAEAPRLWAQGHYAEVIAYNVADVTKTKALFEMICAGKPILRGDYRPILLPPPPGLEPLNPL